MGQPDCLLIKGRIEVISEGEIKVIETPEKTGKGKLAIKAKMHHASGRQKV